MPETTTGTGDSDLNAELVNLGFLLDVAAGNPRAFDLETVLGKARRAVAALHEVLKLADDWDAKAKEIGGQVALEDCDGATAGFKMIGYQNHRDHAAALRATITRELPYGSPHE